MTGQSFLDWLFYCEANILELAIYVQEEPYKYTEYNGAFDYILEKEVVSVDLRICNNGMIASVFIK